MQKTTDKIKKELRLYWRNYIFQSFFASLSLFIVILILSFQRVVVVASIGATAFIVFAMPGYITAKPRNVIGGYIVGMVSGVLFSLIPQGSFILLSIIASFCVGFSILIMVITDTEHPPAAGVALALAIQGFTWDVGITVIVSAVVLSIIHNSFRKYLKDLV